MIQLALRSIQVENTQLRRQDEMMACAYILNQLELSDILPAYVRCATVLTCMDHMRRFSLVASYNFLTM